jgi:hypothetical protein
MLVRLSAGNGPCPPSRAVPLFSLVHCWAEREWNSRVQPSLLTRLRWRLEELRHLDDTKLIGGLLLIVALAFGGFFAARAAARKSAAAGASTATQMVTVRQQVRVRRHGHVVTRWRVRRLAAQAQTVLRTQTISTPSGVRLVTHPVTRLVYRNRPVYVPAKTVTLTHQVTDSQVVTVTHRVTVVQTTTAVSTVTQTVPVTITITVPLP